MAAGSSPRIIGTARQCPKNIKGLIGAFSHMDPEGLERGIRKILDQSKRIRPIFSSTWVYPYPPDGVELVKKYSVGDTAVRLYALPDGLESLYQVTPFEYGLKPEHARLIELAKQELVARNPEGVRLERPDQARTHVTKQALPILLEMSKRHRIALGKDRTEEMKNLKNYASILARYTAGFGVSEVFFSDPHIQDIYVDAPASKNKVYVGLGGLNNPKLCDRFITNVILSEREAESILARFKYESGRPFSEANPVLETDISEFSTRVTAIGRPLSPSGVAFALRRHATDPWTLLKLIDNRSLSAQAAGLLSFLIDGRSTILVAGSRGAGKSSLLGALMLEFSHNQRILTIEDTLELPVSQMQKLGFKVQSLFVESSLGGTGQMTADEALRVSLRLGESALVLGEVRGQEARTLYEAMRTGTAGSSVLGTIHGSSAKSVYERVVHDMGIPKKAFEATDIIVVAGLARPHGLQRQVRRVVQVTEVIKGGDEASFLDLYSFDELKGVLVAEGITSASKKVGEIARSWGMSYEEALKNIEVRGKFREILVNYAQENDKPEILQAPWAILSNNAFWKQLEAESRSGRVDYGKLLSGWKKWFDGQVRYL